jgi:hypothetical protein
MHAGLSIHAAGLLLLRSILAGQNVDLARLEIVAPPRVTDLAPCGRDILHNDSV